MQLGASTQSTVDDGRPDADCLLRLVDIHAATPSQLPLYSLLLLQCEGAGIDLAAALTVDTASSRSKTNTPQVTALFSSSTWGGGQLSRTEAVLAASLHRLCAACAGVYVHGIGQWYVIIVPQNAESTKSVCAFATEGRLSARSQQGREFVCTTTEA